MSSQPKPFPIAVLISGGGTTLKNLIEVQQRGELDVEIKLVISSNPAAKGLEFARESGIPTQCLERAAYPDPTTYGEAIFTGCDKANVELVVMGGFLKHAMIPERYSGRVINIHPSLIPSFSGKGFYGERVHRAVLEYGCKLSGCTVHFVNNEYDNGPIIAQVAVDVRPDDSAADLAKRVFVEECKIFPQVIQAIADGRVDCAGRSVSVRPIA